MSVYKYGRTIPEFFKKYREDMSMSQSDLGTKLGVHGQYISNIERGVTATPVALCIKMAEIIRGERKRYLEDLVSEAALEEVNRKFKKTVSSR